MKIQIPTGTLILDDGALPSIDDKNAICQHVAGSLYDPRHEDEKEAGEQCFELLCDASTRFSPELSCAQFLAECERVAISK